MSRNNVKKVIVGIILCLVSYSICWLVIQVPFWLNWLQRPEESELEAILNIVPIIGCAMVGIGYLNSL